MICLRFQLLTMRMRGLSNRLIRNISTIAKDIFLPHVYFRTKGATFSMAVLMTLLYFVIT